MNIRHVKLIVIVMLVSILAVFVTACTESQESGSSRVATLETSKGVIKFELYEDKAPISTSNFIELAQSGFYDGLVFHRVVPGFVIQTGDPTATGTGGSDKTIPLEIHPDLRHTLGAVGMARSSNPNSATSQFYITLAPQPGLDGSYAVFGQVIEGQDVASLIQQGDTMIKVTISEK
ncbi:MAG: peptidylprolyl isomerase [Methanosarcinales archaeon]|nr:peptidylprolyl isomerase [ANME-2 cluster archaeon]MDF1532135.1 peptidylprolyl isomerase [ANME-2 cluster archaeon]MDW7775728.1 peptidylprolyl isomerase [Methanosarcinales archaeon]